MIRITLFIGAVIILSAGRASAAPQGQSSYVTKNASGETQCPKGAAVAKSTTVDPETGAIRVRTICVIKGK